MNDPLVMQPEPVQRLSIVVTVRDDPQLPVALAAASSAGLSCLAVELVLILNGSPDRFTQAVREQVAALPFSATLAYLPSDATIAAARNCGANLARHSALLFLDSDCVLGPESLASLAGQRVRLANGTVDFASSGSWFSRHNSALRDLGYRRLRNVLPYMPNLFIDRDLFDRLGGFDTALPRGEDFEFGDRLVRAGYRPEFLSGLRVVHLDDEHFTKTLRNWYRNGWGGAARRRLQPRRGRLEAAALVTPAERHSHGLGYAVVATLGTLVLSLGYLIGRLSGAGKHRTVGAADPLWIHRHEVATTSQQGTPA